MSSEAMMERVDPRLYGSSEPLPAQVPVRAGPLSAILEGADLRYVALNGELVVLRLYAAVRDESWGTINPTFTAYHLTRTTDSFSLEFAAEHVSHGEQAVDFAWRGRIAGTAAGTIICEMEGAARSPFKRNRIGWCVLHPMTMAGQAAIIDHGDSTSERAFPVPVAPHQPFFDIVSLSHETPGGQAIRFDFAGDLFENEDQRNWTDASYKTYSTPLRIPYPVQLAAGGAVSQRVTLGVVREVAAAATIPSAPPALTVSAEASGPMPAIGLMSPGHGAPLTADEQDRLRRLRLAHLLHVVDLGEADWLARLRQAETDAAAISAALAFELLVTSDEAVRRFLTEVATLLVPIHRISVYARDDVTTRDDVLVQVRALSTAAGLDVAIGGGSRAYFTQFNRNVPTPELLDFVAFGTNPQVHAFDNASMVETLAAQGVTVESARLLVPGKPIVVEPVTLKPRVNPDAVPTAAKFPAGSLPASVDPRQASLFGAGWTVGSMRSLAEANVAAVTYYETTGWRGIMERSDHELRVPAFPSRPGMAFPMYHVFADVGEMGDAQVARLTLSTPLHVDGFALMRGDRLRVLVASYRNVPQRVTLDLPAGRERQVRMLDETTFDLAANDPMVFRQRWTGLSAASGPLVLTLKPFAIGTIDITLIAD